MRFGAHPVNLNAKPHVSEAVRQLRAWVTLACAVVVLCALAQTLVFGFVQYTDVRFAAAKAPKSDRTTLRVVSASVAPEPEAPVIDPMSPETPLPVQAAQAVNGGRTAAVEVKIAPPPPPPRPLARGHDILERVSGVACGVGSLGVVALCVFTLLGVAVAGGGSVPGIERVVTSAAWSMIMAFLVLPWHRILPAMSVPGVFASFELMTEVVDAHQAAGGSIVGSGGAVFQWVVMPLVCGFVAVGICLWFRAGVERGIIITAVSQLDKAVEREANTLARTGGAPAAPRSVGALNRAIGEAAGPLEQALEAAAESAGELVEVTGGAAESLGKRGRSVVDPAFRRLI